MGKKCCCRNRFYDWSYNNPRIDRKLTDLHKRLSELDDILCARKKSEKKRRKIQDNDNKCINVRSKKND